MNDEREKLKAEERALLRYVSKQKIFKPSPEGDESKEGLAMVAQIPRIISTSSMNKRIMAEKLEEL